MFSSSSEGLTFFILFVVCTIGVLGAFIIVIVYRYQEAHLNHNKRIEALVKKHKQTLMQSQLEMQQLTFTNISRRIHSSIGIKLETIKVQLVSLDFEKLNEVRQAVPQTVAEFSQVMVNLSDLCRSMSSEL